MSVGVQQARVRSPAACEDPMISSCLTGDQSHNTDKASKYIHQLNEARCNGQWADVLELARKVEKHASSRSCLYLASRAGYLIFPARNSRAAYESADQQYGQSLSSAIRQGGQNSGDLMDASICLAAIRYGLGDYEGALEEVPETLHTVPPPSDRCTPEEAWAAVCVVLGTLVRGLALEALANVAEATRTYRTIIPFLSHLTAPAHKHVELRKRLEELLSHICLFFGSESEKRPAQLGEAMAAFHLLSITLQSQSGQLLPDSGIFTNHAPRAVWRAYYEALSRVLQEDLVYHPFPGNSVRTALEHRGLLDEKDFGAARAQQRMEMVRIEENYEALLLQQTQFPRAHETNAEVLSWIEMVMANWKIICGPRWNDQELEPGGKTAAGRRVLDMLYRATTKAFHSAPLLRHLFTVHSYLAEFDLAFNALDSYIEITTKGKARSAKSGQLVMSLDDDSTSLCLAAEAVRVAIRYGPQSALEKALNIGTLIQSWLEQGDPDSMPRTQHVSNEQTVATTRTSPLSPSVKAIAYRAVGMSQAAWARETYDPITRSDLQSKAVSHLRKAMSQGLDDTECTETLFALSIVLADTRDVTEAIGLIKTALSPQAPAETSFSNRVVSGDYSKDAPSTESFAKERASLPAWHLLALLLSAKDEFLLASAACEAAFDQFEDPQYLYGDESRRRTSHNQNLSLDVSGGEKRLSTQIDPVIDLMEDLEKRTLLEIKMTQLSLMAINDGPEIAVNATNELLGLYARLFGHTELRSSKYLSPMPVLQRPPKSSGGSTIRNIFSRAKSSKQDADSRMSFFSSANASRPATGVNGTPSIQVTDSENVANGEHHHMFDRHSKADHKLHKRRSVGFRDKALGRSDKSSRPSTAQSTAQSSQRHSSDTARPRPSTGRGQSPILELPEKEHAEGTLSRENNRPVELGRIAHKDEHDTPPPPVGHDDQPSVQDTRLPVPHPQSGQLSLPPHFLDLQQQRMKISTLIQIWLFVARLYGQSSLFDDAKEAIEEASKAVAGLELDVALEQSSTKNFQDCGWGGGDSIEKLWSDIFCASGQLYQSQMLPHQAMRNFEQALVHSPNHVASITGLASILLDIYTQAIPPEVPNRANNNRSSAQLAHPALTNGIPVNAQPDGIHSTAPSAPNGTAQSTGAHRGADKQPSPPELYRLTARDRAHALLSSVTRLGTGWDDAAAWLTLARAHEESGQLERAKAALWWCVELEDSAPVRRLADALPGRLVL